MEVESVLRMNGGTGKTSYANNSIAQTKAIWHVRPLVEVALKGLYSTTFLSSKSECIKIADLGCSSGPNTYLVISEILETIHGLCGFENGCSTAKSMEVQVYLNDLPGNDFNSIFRSVPAFYEKLKEEKGKAFGPCFVMGVPGTFYRQLFPSNTLHFLHSSYGPHWLSRVPKGITNKGNIYISKTSPPRVFTAYKEQFKKDFSSFLNLRSKEMISGGRMVLTIDARISADPTTKDCNRLWELLTSSLLDLVLEGLIEEGDVDTFNLPYYTPYKGEVGLIIEEEGSFQLDRIEIFDVNWDPTDDDTQSKVVAMEDAHRSGENAADAVRAVFEPMLAAHFGFGDAVGDRLFERFAQHVADHLSVEKTMYTSLAMSLVKH